MIFSGIFKKTIFLSLLGHITVISIFSFSFGKRTMGGDYANVSSWGAILNNTDLTMSQGFRAQTTKCITIKTPDTSLLKQSGIGADSFSNYYLKPTTVLVSGEGKKHFIFQSAPPSLPIRKKEAVIMFYPQLPYNFLIYFQDRQLVHIELMYNIISRDSANSIIIKRKISSGNLEVDLLSMRYIGHYLFIQQDAFAPNIWQTVKIDLSTKTED